VALLAASISKSEADPAKEFIATWTIEKSCTALPTFRPRTTEPPARPSEVQEFCGELTFV